MKFRKQKRKWIDQNTVFGPHPVPKASPNGHRNTKKSPINWRITPSRSFMFDFSRACSEWKQQWKKSIFKDIIKYMESLMSSFYIQSKKPLLCGPENIGFSATSSRINVWHPCMPKDYKKYNFRQICGITISPKLMRTAIPTNLWERLFLQIYGKHVPIRFLGTAVPTNLPEQYAFNNLASVPGTNWPT